MVVSLRTGRAKPRTAGIGHNSGQFRNLAAADAGWKSRQLVISRDPFSRDPTSRLGRSFQLAGRQSIIHSVPCVFERYLLSDLADGGWTSPSCPERSRPISRSWSPSPTGASVRVRGTVVIVVNDPTKVSAAGRRRVANAVTSHLTQAQIDVTLASSCPSTAPSCAAP